MSSVSYFFFKCRALKSKAIRPFKRMALSDQKKENGLIFYLFNYSFISLFVLTFLHLFFLFFFFNTRVCAAFIYSSSSFFKYSDSSSFSFTILCSISFSFCPFIIILMAIWPLLYQMAAWVKGLRPSIFLNVGRRRAPHVPYIYIYTLLFYFFSSH